jgi:uncharacterized CHY-type Zn-finger protein
MSKQSEINQDECQHEFESVEMFSLGFGEYEKLYSCILCNKEVSEVVIIEEEEED